MVEKVRCYLILVLAVSLAWCLNATARQITDMAGRRVTVPEVIHKVYGTSPPATYMTYAMDPGLIAGLNSPLNPSEKQYLIDPHLQKLPVIGGWFGQGRVSNLETLLQVQPDIVLVWIWRQSAVQEKIERALAPLNIPVVYLVLDTLADYPTAFRFLGKLLDRPERAEALGLYAEQTLAQIAQVRADISEDDWITVYYAEGADGLSTECDTSVHAQLIPLSGGKNVHRCNDSSTRGLQKISLEQVLHYDPQVIVTHDPLFSSRLHTDPKWKNIRAVRDGRIYKIPTQPFNWFDRPPSFMRLLGIKWLAHQLYPKLYPLDIVAETQRFYQLFLKVSLDEATARELLQP